jgi:TFIIF-interacting CTD phosphatase-like protein
MNFEKDLNKVIKVILSCNTFEQMEVSKRMAANLFNLYKNQIDISDRARATTKIRHALDYSTLRIPT